MSVFGGKPEYLEETYANAKRIDSPANLQTFLTVNKQILYPENLGPLRMTVHTSFTINSFTKVTGGDLLFAEL